MAEAVIDMMARVERLTSRKRALLAGYLAAVPDPTQSPLREPTLVAYVVPANNQEIDPNELKQYLRERLPEYMVPSSVVTMATLPRTPNGKLDASALPDPERFETWTEAFVAPRNELEGKIAAIWEMVMGFGPLGVHDNYFEIGGDSIQSIQIVARMRREGLHVSPTQLFEHQTIASLSSAVGTVIPEVRERGPARGSVPLTPIQHWFFEQRFAEPHHWQQSLWLSVSDRVEVSLLEQALRILVAQHDALRLSFEETAGGWHQSYPELDAAVVGVKAIDLSAYDRSTQLRLLDRTASYVQASMNLADPPLLRAALFHLGSGESRRLLLSIHHLVVDPISWQILLEDLETSYRQLEQGSAVQLPDRSAAFHEWAEALETHTRSDILRSEQAFWLSDSFADTARLPVDDPTSRFTEVSARTYTVQIGAEETRSFSQEVHVAYRTRSEDLLLTALAKALTDWTGASSFLVGLERHGREDLQDGLDLTRTVGWFTSFFPIRLHLLPGMDPGAAIKEIKEQIRRIPRNGLGYGVLRYLSDDHVVRAKLKALPQPEIIFNYTGRTSAVAGEETMFRPLDPLFVSRGSANHRTHLIEVNAYIQGDRLTVAWTYSSAVHRAERVEDLANRYADHLRHLIAHCRSPEAGGYTPSDFPDAGLNQTDLDTLLRILE